MSISAISANYLPYTAGPQSSTSAASSTTTAGDSELQTQFHHHRKEKGNESTMDSESAAAFFSGQMSQGLMAISATDSQDTTTVNGVSAPSENGFSGIMPPPPPPQMSADSTSANNQDDPLSSFLAKVESGTVTDSDLTDMQKLLTQVQSQSDESASNGIMMPPPPQMSDNSTEASSQDDTLSSFLAKVQSGSVTDSDLTDMQNLLSQMQTQTDTSGSAATASIMPPPPPPASVQQMRMAAQEYDNNMVYQTSKV